MPCDTRLRENQTIKQREREVNEALARLEQFLTSGTVSVNIGQNGAVAFKGWQDQAGVSDVCAYRTLTYKGSFALREAVARAERTTGRKVNTNAVGAGVHSHDGGGTWHGGH
jgi:hypothetical protein